MRRFGLRRAVRYVGIALAGALVLAGLAAGGLWCYLRPVAADGEPRVVVIAPGASAWQIGRLLTDAGLVREAWTVVAVARGLGVAGTLRHGEYELSPAQSTVEIVRAIHRGATVLHRVMIPEGYTVTQVAEVLAGAGLVERARFLDLALRDGRRLAHAVLADLPADSLEGYLFPDTYLLPRGMGEDAVLGRLLDRLAAALDEDLRQAAQARGLSMHQLLTVASMIEREARVPDERPVIAGVIYNRLRRNMRLEIDATVLYALGEHRDVVTYSDLKVDSPYNTYRYGGLPPGPIANPGLAAIQAAAAPADVPYLFYVLKPDGRHHFSRTLAEHLEAVRRYRP